MPAAGKPSDEELLRRLAAGDDAALRELHRRHAPSLVAWVSRSLDASAAEDVVQEAFVAVWQNAAGFDPSKGSFQPWLQQIARGRMLNEQRRRQRHPGESAEDGVLDSSVSESPPADEAVWARFRRETVHAALNALPPPQRQALSLAFLEELTHEQVAASLQQPLGTTKTRIRRGLNSLRALVASAAVLMIGLGLWLLGREYRRSQLNERALVAMTSSDVVSLRLGATTVAPAQTHATYRARPDGHLAVVTLSHFPPLPAGRGYQIWIDPGITGAQHWMSLGITGVDGDGHALLVTESTAVTIRPAHLLVTDEPAGGSNSPTGTAWVKWP